MEQAKVIKSFQVFELSDGTVRVVSGDKRQMARWYALDYLQEKAVLTKQGSYIASLSKSYQFKPTFRKRQH